MTYVWDQALSGLLLEYITLFVVITCKNECGSPGFQPEGPFSIVPFIGAWSPGAIFFSFITHKWQWLGEVNDICNGISWNFTF